MRGFVHPDFFKMDKELASSAGRFKNGGNLVGLKWGADVTCPRFRGPGGEMTFLLEIASIYVKDWKNHRPRFFSPRSRASFKKAR